ncbi:hypothetical protein BJ875DRAFT_201200 [Amylocarpus encephaloides]|uniref:Uncharacterized protein n=1 Tax=Amylocarpus encephaloides TaxID=45428 RepID=A0A9P7Y8Y0_9HELO|nr:hypothetical protein BJ875DRAFT_201200 [Amylocarpus encephaloides]
MMMTTPWRFQENGGNNFAALSRCKRTQWFISILTVPLTQVIWIGNRGIQQQNSQTPLELTISTFTNVCCIIILLGKQFVLCRL